MQYHENLLNSIHYKRLGITTIVKSILLNSCNDSVRLPTFKSNQCSVNTSLAQSQQKVLFCYQIYKGSFVAGLLGCIVLHCFCIVYHISASSWDAFGNYAPVNYLYHCPCTSLW